MDRNKLKFFLQIKPFDLRMFENSSVYLQRPHLIALYSYRYEVCTPAKYIKYFKKPEAADYPINLNDGYSTCRFRKPPVMDSRLHLPLNYAMSSEEATSGNLDRAEHTAVYTGRRVLTQLMEFCYAKFEFRVDVSRYNGNIYMAGETSTHQTNPENSHHNRLEQVLFADSPDEKPKIDEPLDENIGMSCLHRANLGKYDLIYAGEVQGIIADEKVASFDDMDALNKCRFVFTKQMWAPMKKDYKFLKFWIQAYLAGVDDIYMAYKNKSAVIEQPIEHIKVSSMPQMCFWKPVVCVGFVNEFLDRVDNLMSDVNSLDTVYEFHFHPAEKTIHYKMYEGKTDKSFIPKVYADFIAK